MLKRGLGSLFFMRENGPCHLKRMDMRLVQITLLILIALLQYRFWFAENGYLDHRRLVNDVAEQEARLQVQQQINANLQARVDDLKSGNDAIEELARQNLGLIMPGETFVMMTDE